MEHPSQAAGSWGAPAGTSTLDTPDDPLHLPWPVVTYSRSTLADLVAPPPAPAPAPIRSLRLRRRSGRRGPALPMALTTFLGTLVVMFAALVALTADDGALWDRLHHLPIPYLAPDTPAQNEAATPAPSTIAAVDTELPRPSASPSRSPAAKVTRRPSPSATAWAGGAAADPGAVGHEVTSGPTVPAPASGQVSETTAPARPAAAESATQSDAQRLASERAGAAQNAPAEGVTGNQAGTARTGSEARPAGEGTTSSRTQQESQRRTGGG